MFLPFYNFWKYVRFGKNWPAYFSAQSSNGIMLLICELFLSFFLENGFPHKHDGSFLKNTVEVWRSVSIFFTSRLLRQINIWSLSCPYPFWKVYSMFVMKSISAQFSAIKVHSIDSEIAPKNTGIMSLKSKISFHEKSTRFLQFPFGESRSRKFHHERFLGWGTRAPEIMELYQKRVVLLKSRNYRCQFWNFEVSQMVFLCTSHRWEWAWPVGWSFCGPGPRMCQPSWAPNLGTFPPCCFSLQ